MSIHGFDKLAFMTEKLSRHVAFVEMSFLSTGRGLSSQVVMGALSATISLL